MLKVFPKFQKSCRIRKHSIKYKTAQTSLKCPKNFVEDMKLFVSSLNYLGLAGSSLEFGRSGALQPLAVNSEISD